MRRPFQERIQNLHPMLLDGATGTELSRRGIDLNSPAWTAQVLLDSPEILWQVHRDYVEAGSEVVTANTFRTHARNLKSIGQSDAAAELTARAVEIARSAAGPEIYVAGSMAPLEDCYSPHLTPEDLSLSREHQAMADSLANAEVDLILVETQLTIREATIAATAARNTGLPFAVSFVCDRVGNLLSGESLLAAYHAIEALEPVAFLVNCIPADEVLQDLGPILALPDPLRVGAYANTGRLLADGSWEATSGSFPAVYAGFAEEWLQQGLSWIGGCCGTTPEHISRLNEILCDESS